MKRIGLITLTAAAALIVAAVALATIRVYSNDFSSRAEFKEVRAGGKGCKKDWEKKKKRLEAEARKSPGRCKLKVPVIGDTSQPDHQLSALAKVDKSVPRKIRKKVYVAVTVREGGKDRYEFRVYPQRRRYELRREPGAQGFPEAGRDRSIGKVGERNKLRIRAFGDKVQAKVGKQKIGPVTDSAADDLRGARMSVALGVEGRTKKPVGAWFDDVDVRIPQP